MAPHQSNYRIQALALVKERGIARARDFKSAGIPLTYLKRLCDEGGLIRLGRGLYQHADMAGTDIAHDLAEAARRVPKGVVCLISALRYHGLTTQLPHAVWLTIPHKARTPLPGSFPLEIVRATGDALTSGIEYVQIEGVHVPIYGIAKTIADCFKYRRHVGEDVAIEALRDALHQRKVTPADMIAFATVDRVAARVRPILQALL